MRVLPVKSVSGRIVLGFFVLVATFSSVSAYTIYRMDELGRELRFMRSAYLEVALKAAQLVSLQAMIVDAVDDPTVRRPFIKRNRDLRKQLFSDSQRQMASLAEVPAKHRATVERMRQRIEYFAQSHEDMGPLYDAAFGTPPDRTALEQLKQRERRLLGRTRSFFGELKNTVEATTIEIERAEHQARVGALVLGAIAAFLGLLVTTWAVLTLRPLRRLRDGVRRIARGDYRQRVDVVGETEVAEVAREFNAMAAALEEREQELVRAARLAAVGKMAAVITHEVRNPLSSIGLHTELLEEELAKLGANGAHGANGASEAASLCRAIQKEVDRLTSITEEYLRFARLPRPKLEEEAINDLVADLVEFQREELAQAGIRVVARYAEGLPPIAADEAQLRQALLNLIRNAADAMTGTGGELTVATRRSDEGGVEVAVSDTGPGIAAEHLGRIFEPFFSTKDRGTGLGLALTQQIVVEHGGRVEVDSQPGRGTTFVVKLPAGARPQAA